MKTYNLLYSTDSELKEFSESIKITSTDSVLVRIHTSIHAEKKAVSLASYVKSLIPKAVIVGTSTSAVIFRNKIYRNNCLISVTVFNNSTINHAMFKCFENYKRVNVDLLCDEIKSSVISKDSKFMFTFFTSIYDNTWNFVERCNECFPNVVMIGGLANSAATQTINYEAPSFIFNENEYMNDGLIVATINGEEYDSLSSFITGAAPVGKEVTVTKCFCSAIMEIDDTDAGEFYRETIGDVLLEDPSIANLFPYVFSERDDIPYVLDYRRNSNFDETFFRNNPYNQEYLLKKSDSIDIYERKDHVFGNFQIKKGSKIKRAFIFNQKLISENKQIFKEIKNFDKQEAMFAYMCVSREAMYPNLCLWELSLYAETEINGCILTGEIVHRKGKNYFANCTFSLTVCGEKDSSLLLNEYALKNTDDIFTNDSRVIEYLANSQKYFDSKNETNIFNESIDVRKDFEKKILFDEKVKLANFSGMLYDLSLNRINKIAIVLGKNIDIYQAFLDKNFIKSMLLFYLDKISSFAKKNNYNCYVGKEYGIILATSENISDVEFKDKLQELIKLLNQLVYKDYSIEYSAYVNFEPDVDEIDSDYKNIVISLNASKEDFITADNQKSDFSISSSNREMVEIIFDAIENDRVIPFYQGVHNNKTDKIDFYESLMRIEDANGKIYYPDNFLPVARNIDILYHKLSFKMIDKVLRTFRDKENVTVSINLTISDIKNNKTITHIFNFLRNAPHPENYVFEIVENEDIDDYKYVCEFVSIIHLLSAKVALDDFGSGYCNLMHIINLDFDYLKIDGEIIKHCPLNRKCNSVVQIVDSWRRLTGYKVKVIAEYVENEDIQNFLIENDIDYSQGYYYAKPERLFND